MGLLTELRSVWSGPITSSSPELARLWATPPTSTGLAVNEYTALNYSAFFGAVALISSQVAAPPLILYKRLTAGGKDRLPKHSLYWLLHDEPNPEMSSFVFRESMTAHAITWGNGYAEIERDGADRPKALWPLTPNRVTPMRDRNKNLVYEVQNPDGGKPTYLPMRNMLHLPGLGFDGTMGYSVVSKARESIGLGLATERFGGSFFGNGATFGGILKHPGKLSDNAKKHLVDQIETKHQGLSRAHRFLLLQEAMDYVQTGVPPEAAQFLQTREFQIIEICRWLMLPPHKLRDLSRATFSNIEQQAIEFVTDTLRPWFVRWEQEINRKLILPLEQGIQFAEHLVDSLLRGDIASRYAAYAVGRQWGWLSADDVREKENLNPLGGGDGAIYLVPTNMAPANRVDELITSQIKKNTAPPPTPQPNNPQPDNQQQNSAAALDALRAEIATAQARAEEHLTRAVAAETTVAESQEHRATLEAERDRALAAAAEAQADVTRLNGVIAQIAEPSVETLRTQLADAITRAESHLTRALAAETVAGPLAETQSERDRHAAAATAAQADVARLNALLIVAAEAQAREQADRERAEVESTAARDAALVATQRAEAEEAARQIEAAARAAAEAGRMQSEQDAEALRVSMGTAEAALDAQRAGALQRLTAVLAAHRGLIVDAMGRLVRRETAKARGAHATPEKLRRWMDAFYVTHEDAAVEILLPAVRTHLAWSQSADDPLTVTRRLMREHVAESVRQLRAVANGDPEDLHVSLERMMQRWEEDRPAALADQILREEVEYVRSL
jgi:HK97 family phage portal protein